MLSAILNINNLQHLILSERPYQLYENKSPDEHFFVLIILYHIRAYIHIYLYINRKITISFATIGTVLPLFLRPRIANPLKLQI